MQQFLSDPITQAIAIPMVFVLIGVLANRLGRRDGDDSPRRNDWAVGTTLLLTTLGVVASDLPTFAQRNDFVTFFGAFILYLAFVFLSIDNDRYRSWERKSDGQPLTTKHIVWGILLPNVIGLVSFFAYLWTFKVQP
jgi:hypothetical protein